MKHSFSNELYKTASCMPTPAISRCLLSYEYGPFSKGPKVMTNGNSKTFQKKIDSKDCFTLGAGKAGTKHDPNWCSCSLVQFVLNLKILITKSRYFGGAIQSAFSLKAFFTSQILL